MLTSTKDIGLHESGSGGEMTILNDDLLVTETLFNTIYLALFGGNVEANTIGNENGNEERFDYWANSLFHADSPGKQFNSNTERALRNTALNSAGRLKIEQAIKNDLEFLATVVDITINVVILSYNKIQLSLFLESLTDKTNKNIQFTWDNAKSEIIINKQI